MAFEIDAGTVDGVDMAGRKFVMIGDTPADMTAGNWRVGVLVDDAAYRRLRR
jgi:hypothetical protein